MAPTRSISLRKLSALLFDGPAAASDSEGSDDCLGDDLKGRFERAVSEDTTVPGQPFSRNVSPEVSDDDEPALEEMPEAIAAPTAVAPRGRLEAWPQAAALLRGHVVDPGEEVLPGQELIAVAPGGEARFVPEEELAELAYLRACFEEPASPLFLVGRDGVTYLAEDGDCVDWDRLDALRAGARDETVVSPMPSLASDAGCRARSPELLRPLCPAARSLVPLELEQREQDDEEDLTADFWQSRPEGSIPRTPSLKRLSKLLFTVTRDGRSRGVAGAEVEELELEGPDAPRKEDSGYEARQRCMLSQLAEASALGCSLQ